MGILSGLASAGKSAKATCDSTKDARRAHAVVKVGEKLDKSTTEIEREFGAPGVDNLNLVLEMLKSMGGDRLHARGGHRGAWARSDRL